MKKLALLLAFLLAAFAAQAQTAPAAVIYYSKTTNGFYNSLINKTLPSDVVVITQAQHDALMAAQSSGQVVQADSNGNPTAVTPTLTVAQRASAALAAGIQITSTSMPSLNGTYSLDQNSLVNITGTVAFIGLKAAFPGNTATMTWYDAAGSAHVFTIVAAFEAFAEAACGFVAAIQEWQLAGGTGTIPSNQVTIP